MTPVCAAEARYTLSLCLYVCLPVRPSCWRIHSVKTTKPIIKQWTPNSTGTPCFLTPNYTTDILGTSHKPWPLNPNFKVKPINHIQKHAWFVNNTKISLKLTPIDTAPQTFLHPYIPGDKTLNIKRVFFKVCRQEFRYRLFHVCDYIES